MTYLLPRSGVGVWPPWLVMAPAGNPPIRLDLRTLDTIEHASEDDLSSEPDQEEAKTSREGLVARRASTVVLVRGALKVALYISDGEEAAARIVSEAEPFTREHAGATPPIPAMPSERGATLRVILSTESTLVGRCFDIASGRTTIGRVDENDIIIEHPSISSSHAAIARDPETGRYSLADLGSSNEVRVNGRPHNTADLHSGDIVDLGHVRMRFDDPAELAPATERGRLARPGRARACRGESRGRIRASWSQATVATALGVPAPRDRARRSGRVHVYELARYLVAVARDDVLATSKERRVSVGPEMQQLLVVDDWHHPDLAGEERPSRVESFQQLARVLETGDLGAYRPTESGNTHWKHWPNGGSL